MAVFVLVHGGCHSGACWDKVAPLLAARGHRVLAPDLPGMGEDPTPLAEITLARWARFVADLAAVQDEPVVLVGHSRGGSVISEAAELAPEAVAGLIYVSAVLMRGGSVPMAESAEGLPELLKYLVVSEDGATTTVEPDGARAIFYHRATDADARWAAGLLCPEPNAPNLEPLTVTAERWGRLPRAFIECSDDRAIPLAFQRRMQAALPCDPVVTIDSDHSPFLCKPAELADHLATIGEAFAARSRMGAEAA